MADRRDDKQVKEFLKAASIEGRPMVDRSEMDDLEKLAPVFRQVTYPVETLGDLVDQLGGPDAKLTVGTSEVEVGLMARRVPSHYFPITSPANFVEKAGELIRDNRPRIDVRKELASLRRQLADLEFPIKNRDELINKLGPNRRVRFRGGVVTVGTIAHRVPEQAFPIRSRRDFEKTAARLMTTMPLIVSD